MLGEEEDIEEFDFEDWCCRLLKKRPRNVEDEFPIDQAKVAAYDASVAQKLEVAEQKFKVKVGIEFYTAKTTSGRPLSLLSIAILSI